MRAVSVVYAELQLYVLKYIITGFYGPPASAGTQNKASTPQDSDTFAVNQPAGHQSAGNLAHTDASRREERVFRHVRIFDCWLLIYCGFCIYYDIEPMHVLYFPASVSYSQVCCLLGVY